ncbi:MAG: hypothetical protein ACREMV_06655 [Gemmatimonadales bacterium]
MNAVPGQPYYYASWAGYNPPVKPHQPIDYASAEASNAFSVFVFDGQGRVVSFAKWLASTTQADPALLAGQPLPPGLHLFAAGRDGSEGPGPELSLDDTKRLSDYYRAQVDADGRVAAFGRVHRQQMLRHEYEYWENGGLRQARYGPPPVTVEHFDREGRKVEPS